MNKGRTQKLLTNLLMYRHLYEHEKYCAHYNILLYLFLVLLVLIKHDPLSYGLQQPTLYLMLSHNLLSLPLLVLILLLQNPKKSFYKGYTHKVILFVPLINFDKYFRFGCFKLCRGNEVLSFFDNTLFLLILISFLHRSNLEIIIKSFC